MPTRQIAINFQPIHDTLYLTYTNSRNYYAKQLSS